MSFASISVSFYFCFLGLLLVLLWLWLSYQLMRMVFFRQPPVPLSACVHKKPRTEEESRWFDYAVQKEAEFLALEPEVWTMKRDGLMLRAAFLPAKQAVSRRPGEEGSYSSAKGTVIVVHGWRDQRTYRYHEGLAYHEAGFHVLHPDLRASGESEGRWIDLALEKHLDLNAWIDFAISKGVQGPFFFDGLSMGAATVLSLSAPPDQHAELRAIVADCPYTSVTDQAFHMLSKWTKPVAAIMILGVLVLSAFYGRRLLASPSPLDAVQKTGLPILFIHGEKDRFVPYWMGQRLFEACSSKEKAWISVPDCGHADACVLLPGYMDRKIAFFEAYGAGEAR